MSPHVFHEAQKSKLIGEERRRLQPAEDIIGRTVIGANDKIADLGCGNGYLTLDLAKAGAMVYALDAQKEMLDDLMERSNGNKRIIPVLAKLPDIPLRSDSLDHIFMVNILHELTEKATLISECHRILKPDGRLTLVDFQKRPTVMGPPLEERIPEESVAGLFSNYHLVEEFSFPEFYQFEFKKIS